MHSAITPLIRFVARHVLSLLVIAIILIAGKAALEEWKTLESAENDVAVLSASNSAVSAYARPFAAATNQQVARYRGASIGALDARIATTRDALHAHQRAVGKPILTFPLPTHANIADRVGDYYKRQVDIELRQQELAYLERLRTTVSAGQKPQQALTLLYGTHVDAHRRLLLNQQALRQLNWLERPWKEAKLLTEQRILLRDNMRAYTQYQATLRALPLMSTSWDSRGFIVDQARIDAVVAPLRDARARAQSAVTGNWVTRLSQPVLDVLPLAGLVLLGSFVGHFAIKAFFYYVLAPFATRHKPICLDRLESGRIALRGASAATLGAVAVTSAVSQSIRLDQDELLLILPDHIQSLPVASETTTRWLLDCSDVLTSLISGMYLLTCIRASGSEPVIGSEPIIVSAGEDPLSEIALITLPAGAAMVFQPRCMVGVIYPTATPLKITRQWRLASAHAWLTLQLRYLIFNGPVTLIVKGTRGVRVEPAGRGRLISQLATLGFSASADYATVRCETFYPFYQGKISLLQDRFEGRSGYYVYDETPRAGKKSNFVGRGLEGISDAALKVFGF